MSNKTHLDFLNSLDDEDVIRAVQLVSDETGRPIAEEWVGIAELLKSSDVHQTFHRKYCAFLNIDEMDEYAIRTSRAYFMIYLAGIKRVGENNGNSI